MQSYYSNIYWHFTGGPKIDDWGKIRMPKEIKGMKKCPDESVGTLKKIISSRILLGNCTEKIYGNIRTDGFCCVCDIPFKDLMCHAEYYGEVAIGFSAKAIHGNFYPVLYMDRDFPIPLDLQIDLSRMLDTDKKFNTRQNELFNYLLGLEESVSYQEYLSNSLGYLKQFIKITEFSKEEDETFYREREWRSRNGDFKFTLHDIEAVIMPKVFIPEFKSFLLEEKIDADFAILPYEFLKDM